jgi:5-formyltetrahydrofolate cyclo-ligase
MSEKNKAIRRSICRQREQLTEEFRQQVAESICRTVRDQPEFQEANHIAVFRAIRGEVNLLPIIQQAWDLGKHTYLPVILQRGQPLEFREFTPHTRLIVNSYGIAEPSAEIAAYPLEEIELVLAPLAAFDRNCNRLGMGAGYYDRTFPMSSPAGQRQLTHRKRPTLLGVAYEFQCVSEFDRHEWDVPMDKIVTESHIYRRGPSA